MNKIIAYTDGSASVKGERLGGFGVYIIDGSKDFMYNGGYQNTKTGRMELKAVITCLQKITDKGRRVEIHSDSEYVVKCITERRLWKWQMVQWIGIKNVDLIKQFFEEYKKFEFPPKLFHVKGHTGLDDDHSLGNSIADILANYKQFKEYKQDLQ